ATVHGAHRGAAVFARAAMLARQLVQFLGRGAAVVRALQEHGLQVLALGLVGALAEAVFAVLGAFGEFLEHVDDVGAVAAVVTGRLRGAHHAGDTGAGSGTARAAVLRVGTVPGGLGGLAGARPVEAGAAAGGFPLGGQLRLD